MYGKAPEPMKRRFDAMNVALIYMWYYAKGSIVFTDPSAQSKTTGSGDMIYEYAYLGKPYGSAHA